MIFQDEKTDPGLSRRRGKSECQLVLCGVDTNASPRIASLKLHPVVTFLVIFVQRFPVPVEGCDGFDQTPLTTYLHYAMHCNQKLKFTRRHKHRDYIIDICTHFSTGQCQVNL